jgi:deoxyribodipyrimidine photo-lyase
MVELMGRYSLDGRNPCSFAGYFWVLGRYDRPWPPRPVYGNVRSMSSAATAKKVRVARYLARYGGGETEQGRRIIPQGSSTCVHAGRVSG